MDKVQHYKYQRSNASYMGHNRVVEDQPRVKRSIQGAYLLHYRIEGFLLELFTVRQVITI